MPAAARRRFLHATLALSATALAPARSRAVEPLRVLCWHDYLSAEFLSAFSNDTGYPVALTRVSSNDEMLERMRTDDGRGFDLVAPTHTRAFDWAGSGR